MRKVSVSRGTYFFSEVLAVLLLKAVRAVSDASTHRRLSNENDMGNSLWSAGCQVKAERQRSANGLSDCRE